jgi:hypothetical protein
VLRQGVLRQGVNIVFHIMGRRGSYLGSRDEIGIYPIL